MLFWFLGGAFVIVWNVFRDPALDHRLVLVGAIAPDVLDAPMGHHGWAHSVVVPVAVLAVVMLATQRRRRLRRQLLAVPIGLFLHLVLDGAWSNTEVFWWPLSGLTPVGDGIPSLDRPSALLILQEIAGLGLLAWVWQRFGFADPSRRAVFLRTGRLDRALAAGPPSA